MRTVWKYPIPRQDMFALEMPYGAQPLCVAMHGDEPFMWARVDPEAAKVRMAFQLIGTGAMLPAAAVYIGTFFDQRFGLVWHVFQVANPSGDAA